MINIKMKNLKIYTDGSCIGNPGPGGWAAIILNSAKPTVLRGGDSDTTNNRMEMTAIIEALKWMSRARETSAEIFSDSNLLIQSLTKNWKRKKNKDLWLQLDKNLADKTIKWTWVKGHANNKYNEGADKIALAESIKAKTMSPMKRAALRESLLRDPQRKLF